MKNFPAAKLDKNMLVISILVTILLVALGLFLIYRILPNPTMFGLLPGIFPFIILGAAIYYKPKSYEITPTELSIKQYGTTTKVLLKDIQSIEDTILMSNKSFGTASLYGYVGKVNKNENWYVTNKSRMLCIKTQVGYYMISPEDIEDFKIAIKSKK